MARKASGKADLPLADREREWNGDAARERIFRWAGWQDRDRGNLTRTRQAFFAYDESEPEDKTAYKLPFADVIDGELKAVPRGIFAVAQVLEGARGGVDLPDNVQRAIRRKVTTYYHKLNEEPPW